MYKTLHEANSQNVEHFHVYAQYLLCKSRHFNNTLTLGSKDGAMHTIF